MATSGVLDFQLKTLVKVKSQLEAQALKIIAEIQEQIIYFNTYRQLYDKGEDSTGSLLKPYTRYTEMIKRESGQVYDRTTLRDTESFYKGFYLTAKNGIFEISSSDDKTDELMQKYGKDIFGLNPIHEKETNEEITERLIEWLISKM